MNRDALWRILGLHRVPSKLINVMSELYSGAESAVRRGDTISDLFPVVTVVCQGCVLAPTLFSTCMDWILGRMSKRSSCGTLFGNVKISDLDFTDDAVIFAETLDVLWGALEVLNKESEPLGLWVTWVKTKIQTFNITSWMLLSCLYLFVARMLWSQRDSLTLSVIFMSASCEPEVNGHLDQACGVMDSLDDGVWRCRYPCRAKVRVFRFLVLLVLLYRYETWTLTRDLRWRLNFFGTRSLRRILRNRWSDFVYNEQLLRDS